MRGLGAHAGAFTNPGAMQDIIDADCLQGPITLLTGATDAINPHVPGNYILTGTVLDAMTLGLPTAGVDDGLTIAFYAAVAGKVHTLTLPSAAFSDGIEAAKTIATWTTGFLGQGLTIRAFNATWMVLSTTGTITFT